MFYKRQIEPTVKIGKINRLRVVKEVDFGVYLDGGEYDNILLPKKYVPDNTKIDDQLEVFIYLDSEDLLIATTQRPRVKVGECAYLECIATNQIGAFMDWGLTKDLLVPFAEQNKPMEEGKSYMVYAYVDNASERIAGSTKLSKYLDEINIDFKPDQEVSLQIAGRTDLGYKAVIDGTHLGLIFSGEIFQPLKFGKKVKGYIKNIRLDGKIDLCLQKHDQESRDELSSQILEFLTENGGVSYLTDKSRPEEIYKEFKVSKKSYKKALGGLFKQKVILIQADKITLL